MRQQIMNNLLDLKDNTYQNNKFTDIAIGIIRRIPFGMVTTYGMIAERAGNRCGARQVSRILHSCSEKFDLPWHRVVNRKGEVPFRSSMDHHFQRRLLEQEGVIFSDSGVIDFQQYLWWPD